MRFANHCFLFLLALYSAFHFFVKTESSFCSHKVIFNDQGKTLFFAALHPLNDKFSSLSTRLFSVNLKLDDVLLRSWKILFYFLF